MHILTLLNLLYFSGDERGMARQSFTQLASEGIIPRHVVSDGDSSAFAAAEDVYFSGHSSVEPSQQLDPQHVNRNLCRQIAAAEFPMSCFPGCVTKERKRVIQQRLALDLSKR